MDHRVEPPSWLPQGAAPKAADPEAEESPAAPDTPAAEDSAAEGTPEEFSNGNGRDSAHTYSPDDYHYGDDGSYAEGASYRGPFTPHLPGYGADPAVPAGSVAAGDDTAEAGPAGDGRPASDLPGNGLPASGLADPNMPESGFPGAGFPGAEPVPVPYSEHTASFTEHPAAYTEHAAPPYPGTDTLGTGGDSGTARATGASAGGTGAAFSAGAVAGGISSAFRGVKERGSTGRFSRDRDRRPAQARSAAGQPRRANLVIARIEPWSVMKFSFLISLVLWVVLFVAVALLYYALSSLGVFAALQRTLASVTSSQGSAGLDLSKWTSSSRILGYTMLLGAVDVVLITAVSTVGAVIYNLVTHLGGGIEVTLKETD